MKCISLFKCNPHIEVIDKSHCSLEDVPNFQNYSRSLEELFLDANRLVELNDNVFKLTRLRRLSCSDNAIQDIPPDIAKLVNLVEIDFNRNKIQNIPEQIKFLRGLQICDFSANNIEYLPSGFMQLKNLTCLTLNYCPIRNLPEEFGLLKNLESLELRENELESLPLSITNLESLKKLDVGMNLISKLPDDIGRLSKLEYLLVDGNRLETIPSKIGRLEKLQCLDLSHQEYGLMHLPDEIRDLTSLTDLHLSDNNLEFLPDGIGNLKNLTIFKADINLLTELNPHIGACVALQELVLTSNQITKLPSSIGNLTDLRSMSVDSNLLDKLPPQIGDLKNLGILTLRDNLISYLPDEVGNLEMLRVLDISGNRLSYLPISLTALNLKALWLSTNQAQPLPRLQIDELPSDGTRILTCYLLPQQSEGDNFKLGEQSENRLPATENSNRPPAVSFDTADIDDGELGDANFVRHDTPHPKELKARHQKLFINNQEISKQEPGGAANAISNPKDANSLGGSYNQGFDGRIADSAEVLPSGLMSAYQHLEYESNGLPEVPLTTPKTTTAVPTKVRELSSSQNWRGEHDFDRHNENSHHSNDRHKKENGHQKPTQSDSHNNSRPKLFHRDTAQMMRSDDRLEESTDSSRFLVMDILIRRLKSHKPGLGLSIAGGKDTPPYKDNDEGIFVSKVTPGGPSEAAGVRVGDKILSVNNNTLYEGITHQKAVDIFMKLRPDCVEFSMRVFRDLNDEFMDYEDENGIENEQDHESQNSRFGKNTQTGYPVVHNVSETTKLTTVQQSTMTSKTSSNSARQAPLARSYTMPADSSEQTNGTITVNRGSAGTGVGNTINNLRHHLGQERPPLEKSKSTATTLPAGMSLFDNPASKNIIYTTLVKNYRHDLGLVLENRAHDESSSWSNIVIAKIKPDSIASRDGKLQVDDRILSINGTDVTGIDVDRIMMILEGSERFIRVVVSRGDADDPIGAALRNMPSRPQLGSWFSSTSNMSHRPSLIDSYQKPSFGSVSSLQKPQSSLLGASKPPKPPKPLHLVAGHDSDNSGGASTPVGDDHSAIDPVARPRGGPMLSSGGRGGDEPLVDAERRAKWRRERLKSIEDDVEMAKQIAEAHRLRREDH